MNREKIYTIHCPECGKVFFSQAKEVESVFPNEIKSSSVLNSALVVAVLTFLILALLICIYLLFDAVKQNNTLEKTIEQNKTTTETAKQEAEKIIVEAETQAKKVISDAEEKATQITSEAIKFEKNMRKLKDQTLHTIYPSLKPCLQGENPVNEQYVESFTLMGNSCSIRLSNKTNVNQRPRVKIHFINDFGFSLGYAAVHWVLDSIAPGEVKIEKTTIYRQGRDMGRPAYFTVEFE